MFASPPHLSQHQRTTSPPPLSSSCSSFRNSKLKTSNPSYHRNQQYSIIGLTNAAGTLVERYSYTAYGTLGIYDPSGAVRTTSTYANRYTYTGREYDADLNLYHFRARWYDPATGGFISRDPLGYVDGMSLYRGYFALSGVDPDGLWKIIRNKGVPRAFAVSEAGDTIESLAFQIGLRPDEYREWLIFPDHLSVDYGGGVSSEVCSSCITRSGVLCPGQTFKIPNTIYQVWVGEVGNFGQWWSGFNEATEAYEARGYRVEKYDFRKNFVRGDQSGTKSTIRQKIIGDIARLRKERALHGLHVTGHGFPYGFITDSYKFKPYFRMKWKKKDSAGIWYSEISGSYRLGIVHLFVCNGGYSGTINGGTVQEGYEETPPEYIVGGRDLFSEMPAPASFYGKQGTFYPTMGASQPEW
ncbi:MAG: RHS repeat-associated core domain-containing protein [Pirellulaceae bacterium]|nr:RHS repeat-associated core domain-containing protein [Pirellulaceae bacterium]